MLRLTSLLIVVAACGTSSEPQPERTGNSAAAVTLPGSMRFYLGQPGIEQDIAAIESGSLLGGGWTRIGTPPLSASAHFDLSAATPAVEFWQSFGVAPGCINNLGPYVAKWTSGQAGVSGTLDVGINGSGTSNVSFDFTYTGDWDLPCGHMAGQWSSENQYLSVPTLGQQVTP
jgi:hypothetical protein